MVSIQWTDYTVFILQAGTIIGPDYRYHYLPSEASFRMAVSLAPGQYIEWTIVSGCAVGSETIISASLL